VKYLIETERLLFRKITQADKEELFKLHSNLAVQKYTGEPIVKYRAEIEKAIQTRISDYEKYGFGRWATILKNGMQFVGWAGLAYLPEFDEIDLGYPLLPEYWESGIATEASHTILIYGFRALKLEKIIAIAMKENKASIKVLEKAGMEFDKFAPYEIGSEDAVWYTCDKHLILKNKIY
jgi:RimJ/RimL family protein N-acetyltransferase